MTVIADPLPVNRRPPSADVSGAAGIGSGNSGRGTVLECGDWQPLPVDPAHPTAPQIYRQLHDAIVSLRLLPGVRLSEIEIGKACGASRTPVREAVARLRAADLVEVWPNRGTYVARLSADRIRAAQFVREAIEIAVVERLIETPPDDPALARIEANLTAQEAAVSEGDAAQFVALDDAFHHLLADATGFARAGEVLNAEKRHMDRLRLLGSLTDPGEAAVLLDHHRAIVTAILEKRPVDARTVLRTHLRRIFATLDRLAAENAAYFS